MNLDEGLLEPAPGLWAAVVAATATSSFEMYDFMVFGYLAPFVGEHFFPSSSSSGRLTRTLEAFSTYSAAFFMRPLGGVLFGRIGDRLGRRAALIRSTALMAGPSLLIGLLPSYYAADDGTFFSSWLPLSSGRGGWGPLATWCLVALRLLQGLALGGQLSGSYVLLVERAPKRESKYSPLFNQPFAESSMNNQPTSAT